MRVLTDKKIAVFGIGGYYKKNRKYIEPYIKIECYSDNDSDKWNSVPFEDGVKCIAPELLKHKALDFIVIGVQKGAVYSDIEKQASDMGFETLSLDYLINRNIDDYEEKCRQQAERSVELLFCGTQAGHRLILVNTPQVTSTIGDHAISASELIFLKENFPNTEIIEIGDRFFWEFRDEIKRRIYPSDVLLIQGGGYLGSLWKMWREDTVRYILQNYPLNNIIVLPQTMYFENNEEGEFQRKLSQRIYNSHDKLTMCFREVNSYRLSRELLTSKVPGYLIPDLVTSLKYCGEIKEKKSAALCFKNDKETLLSMGEQSELSDDLRRMGLEPVEFTMFYSREITSAEEREQVIRDKMTELAGYKLVITDAMHGMVLCAVSGTACIGVESITGKVGGVYEWLKELPYIRYARRAGDIKMMLDQLMPYTDSRNLYENPKADRLIGQLAEIIRAALKP